MRLRYPEGMRSVVDANLDAAGHRRASTLSRRRHGAQTRVYTRRFDTGGELVDFAGSASGQAPAVDPDRRFRCATTSTSMSRQRCASRTTPCGSSPTRISILRGTYDRPVLVGRGEIERGEFNFEGKRYVITRGTIDFNNPTRIEPFFDIETETQVRVPSQTYRVMVRVTGTMARFTPTFSSDPPLPEVQVLSLLFSDVAPGQDVGVQPVQHRDAAGAAAARARGARPDRRAHDRARPRGRADLRRRYVPAHAVAGRRRTRNSSRLDPAARLTIGKRISDRVYLTYSRSLVVDDERSDHPAGVRSDRPLLVDSVAQRGPDLRARRSRQARLLMQSNAKFKMSKCTTR